MTLRNFLHLCLVGGSALALLNQSAWLLQSAWAPLALNVFVGGGTIFGYYCSHPNAFLRWTSWLSGVVGLAGWVVWLQGGGSFGVSVAPVLIWLSYHGFQRPGAGGLRQVALVKPFLVAFAWAWVTVVLPAGDAPWLFVGWMLAERAAFVLALALAYDWVDRAYDQQDGLETLARKLETRRFNQLLVAACVCSAVAASELFQEQVYPLGIWLAMVASLIVCVVWVLFVLQLKSALPWQKHLIDLMMPFQTALVLLLRGF